MSSFYHLFDRFFFAGFVIAIAINILSVVLLIKKNFVVVVAEASNQWQSMAGNLSFLIFTMSFISGLHHRLCSIGESKHKITATWKEVLKTTTLFIFVYEKWWEDTHTHTQKSQRSLNNLNCFHFFLSFFFNFLFWFDFKRVMQTVRREEWSSNQQLYVSS